MRKVFLATLLILAWAVPVFSASVNFKASEQYVIKGRDRVIFTFIYDPADTEPADTLEIELDLGKSDEETRTRKFDNLGSEAMEPTLAVVFDKPGYFEAHARFTTTTTDAEGETSRNFKELGPIDIYVANWKFTANGDLGCIESTPLLSEDGETIFVGSQDGNLYAVDVQEGAETWRFATNGPINSSPARDTASNLYFGSEDGHVYCVEPSSGALNWQFPPGGQPGRGHFLASPALDEAKSRLYIGSTDSYLYALDMDDGSLKWRFPTGAKIISSPVIGFDQTIYFGSLDAHLYALGPDGSEKWRYDAGRRIEASPALDADGTIFVGTSGFRGEVHDDNGLHAVSFTGEKKWFAPKINGFPAAPIITPSGTVIAGSYDNRLYGINRSDGTLNMYKTFSDDVLAAPALDSNGYLFIGARGGTFYALDPDEGDERSGRSEFWEYDLSMSMTGSSPVTGRGFVFVGACDYEKGALFSFVCDTDTENADIGPANNAPWPQARNGSANTGKTGFTPETIAPAITSTDPAPGTEDFDLDRQNISLTFSMPMEPTSIYKAPDPENDYEGFFGFTVAPFDAPSEDFVVTWNEDKTEFTLTLPEGVAFEPGTEYTATILSRAHAEGDDDRAILYNYNWNFSHAVDEGPSNEHNAWSCFVSTLFE